MLLSHFIALSPFIVVRDSYNICMARLEMLFRHTRLAGVKYSLADSVALKS